MGGRYCAPEIVATASHDDELVDAVPFELQI
jgi:hypothetical protein